MGQPLEDARETDPARIVESSSFPPASNNARTRPSFPLPASKNKVQVVHVFVKTNPLTCLHFFSLFLQALLGPLGTLGPKGLGLDTSAASSWFSTVRRTENPPALRACPSSGRATASYTWKDRRRRTVKTLVGVERGVTPQKAEYSFWVNLTNASVSAAIPPLLQSFFI